MLSLVLFVLYFALPDLTDRTPRTVASLLHLYADENQIPGSSQPAKLEVSKNVSGYVSDIVSLMHSNSLKLNSDKTEVL